MNYVKHYTNKLGFGLVKLGTGKRPYEDEWQNNPHTTALSGNIGLHHGYSGTATLDIDHDLAGKALAAVGIGLEKLLQATPYRIIGNPDNPPKPLYRLPDDSGLTTKKLSYRNGPKSITIFELRGGHGFQDVLPPSIHPDTKQPYRWAGDVIPQSRDDIPMLPAPLLMLWRNWETLLPKMQAVNPWSRESIPERKTTSAPVAVGDEIEKARAALGRLQPWRADDYDIWLNVGMALKSLDEGLLPDWERWSQQSGKYKPGECERKWAGFNRNGITIATLHGFANEDDPPAVRSAPVHVNGNGATPAEAAKEPVEKRPERTPLPTHDELRDRYLKSNPLTVYGLGDWRIYEAGLWPLVSELTVKQSISEIVEAAKIEGVKPTAALVSSVTELTKIKIYQDDSIFDSNADYLVCGNGTLHIPTKELGNHNPELYATSGVGYDYDPTAKASNWQLFLMDLTLSTFQAVVDFLQEFAGYALTTDTKHELAVWLYGPPGSGKSTFLEGLQAMLGDRAGLLGLAEIERSRFALANLPGKTLVVSTEQPNSFLASTAVLNAVISGEPVNVDRKFRDAIEVTPRCKIAWAMNELPRVSDPNSGLFRRVKVVEFPAIPESNRDPGLKERIRNEGAGILNWALVGLDRLRKRGRFDIPTEIVTATANFKDNNDIPARFIEDVCIVGNDATGEPLRVKSSNLYNQYKFWCEDNGHKPQSSTSLANDWKRLGFEKRRLNDGNYYFGVGLSVESV